MIEMLPVFVSIIACHSNFIFTARSEFSDVIHEAMNLTGVNRQTYRQCNNKQILKAHYLELLRCTRNVLLRFLILETIFKWVIFGPTGSFN